MKNDMIQSQKKIVVGFIMDGNRRWALENKTTLEISYTKGAEVFFMTIIECIAYKISSVVFYTLSFDNFKKRNNDELNIIYNIGIAQLNNKKDFFIKNKIKIIFIGDILQLKKPILDCIINLEKETNSKDFIITVFILIIYDPYKDIFNNLTEKKLLYSNEIPNIDLIIRTGGHNRLSGFLPIQSMNANIIVLNELWPNIKKHTLYKILANYQNNQNYGK